MSGNRTNKKFLSDVDSKILIKEIKCRPGLYNNNALENPRKDHKQQLWLEVGERLTEPDLWDSYTDVEKEARIDEIREKWRHLRNNFLREIKLIKSGEYNKKRKYIFFDDMEFMKPYVGNKIRGPNKVKREYKDDDDSLQDSMEERRPRRSSNQAKRSRYEESSRESADDNDYNDDTGGKESLGEQDEEFEPQKLSNHRRVSPRRPNAAKTKVSPASKTSTPKQKLTREQEVVIKRFDVLKKFTPTIPPALKAAAAAAAAAKKKSIAAVPAAPAASTSANASTQRSSLRFFDLRDSDISFCMSMVSTFRKMGETRKLRAKIDMLKVLHKYANEVEEARETRMRQQSQRLAQRNNVSNNSDHLIEDELDTYTEEHSLENGTNVKPEIKTSNEEHSNVWWT